MFRHEGNSAYESKSWKDHFRKKQEHWQYHSRNEIFEGTGTILRVQYKASFTSYVVFERNVNFHMRIF